MSIFIKRTLVLTIAALSALSSQAFREDRAVTVAVISLNDFHASFLTDTAQGVPGAGSLWLCIDSLRRVYPNSIVVSAGDNFGGSYFSRKTDDKYLPWFFGRLGITLSVIGNHEFDNGQTFLADRWQSSPEKPSDWSITYVCANVTDSTGRIPSYMQPVALRSISIPGASPIRIAFSGLVTATTPEQAAKDKVEGLVFSPDYAGVINALDQSPTTHSLLDSADIRLLMLHIGTEMHAGRPTWSLPGDAALFSGIDSTRYHGMLSSHSHKLVQGTFYGMPVVQGDCYGRYVSILRFMVDTVSREVKPLDSELCPVHHSNSQVAGKVEIDARIDSILQNTVDKGRALGELLTYCETSLRHDRNKRQTISSLGGMVCASYAAAARTALHSKPHTPIIGMSHIGGIRANIERGPVRVIDAGQVLPFSNNVSLFRMTGKRLKELLTFGLNNRKYGRLQSSGMILTVSRSNNEEWPEYTITKAVYRDPSTGREQKIKDNKMYYVAADDFMTHGGDGYPATFFDDTRLPLSLPLTSEAFFTFLKTFDKIGGDNTFGTVVQ